MQNAYSKEKPHLLSQWSKYLSLAGCCLVFLLGFAVLIGWKLQNVYLIQVHATYGAMVANAAVSFMVISLSVIFYVMNWKYTSVISSTLVLMLSFASLLQNLTGHNFGINNIFLNHNYVYPETYPGQMATNTALCFFLTAIAVLIMCSINTPKKIQLILASVFGFTVTCLGIIFFFGYLINLPEIYAWRYSNPMSIHSALGFAILGGSITLLVYHQSITNKIKLAYWLPIIAGLGVGIGVLMLWQALLMQSETNSEIILKLEAKEYANAMTDLLDEKLNTIRNLTQKWQEIEGLPAALMNEDLSLIVNNGFDELYHFNSDFDVTWQYPNDSANTLNKQAIMLDPAIVADLEKIRDLNKFQLIGPVTINNRSLFIFAAPIFRNITFTGYFLGVLDVSHFFEELNTKTGAAKYSIEIYRNNARVIKLNPQTVQFNKNWIQSTQIRSLGDYWYISLGPIDHLQLKQLQSNLPAVTLWAGLLTSILISIALSLSRYAKDRARELELSQDTLSRSQTIAKLGTWVWEVSSNTVWCSKIALEILGLTELPSSFKAEDCFSCVHPNDQERTLKSLMSLKEGSHSFSDVFTIVRPDDSERIVYIEARVTDYNDQIPSQITGILHDITKLRRLEQQLYQAQKMEIIGQMTGGLAHDFNNLLMVIKGNLDILLDKFPEDSKEANRLISAISAAERGESLTKQLLSFAKRQTLSPQIIDLKNIIPGTVTLFRPILTQKISVDIEIDDNVWPVLVDPNLFENALLNLFVNARDAIENTGTILLKINNIQLDKRIHTFRESIPVGDYVQVTLTDSGKGMAPAVLNRAYEPFFTTKETGKGSGLGLSMVYGFITQSKGYFSITSQPGKGTAVSLYLKRYIKNANPSSSQEIASHDKSIILIVDDEQEIRKLACDYLSGLGFILLEANNGAEALEILNNHPNCNLLFTNINMPAMSGFELWQTASQLYPKLVVLFSSNHSELALFDNNIPDITNNVISKPYKMLDLLAKIRSLLI